MSALAHWLRGVHAEVELRAVSATSPPWTYNAGKAWRSPAGDGPEEFVGARLAAGETGCVAVTGPADDWQSMADAAYIALVDPAATLARIGAERQLLTDHQRGEITGRCTTCEGGTSCGCCSETVAWPCPVWGILAAGWATMPGYQTEWRPAP